MTGSGPRRLVLVPTYNEAANVGPLLSGLRSVCDWDVLFVDDDSPDGTGEAVLGLARSDPGVRLLRREGPRGLGNAYREAYSKVLEEGWDRVFMMDADLSHPPTHLTGLDRALDGSDMAVGSRYLRGVSVLNWSIVRLNMSYAANRYIRTVTGMPFSDCTSGFRGFRSGLLSLLTGGTVTSGYAFLVESLYRVWRSGARVEEVPIVFVERERGSSKLTLPVLLESVVTPLRLALGGAPGEGTPQ